MSAQRRTVTIEFHIGQCVIIKEMGIKARIEAVMFDKEGMTYRIAYWWEGERKTAWCLAEDLQAVA